MAGAAAGPLGPEVPRAEATTVWTFRRVALVCCLPLLLGAALLYWQRMEPALDSELLHDGVGAGSTGNGGQDTAASHSVAGAAHGSLPLCTSNPGPGRWRCHLGHSPTQQESATCLLRPQVWTPSGCALEPAADLRASSKVAQVCHLLTQRWSSLSFVGDSIVRELHEQVVQMVDAGKPQSRCWPMRPLLREPSGAPLCGGRLELPYTKVEDKWAAEGGPREAVLTQLKARLAQPGHHVVVVGLGLWWLKYHPYDRRPTPNEPFWEALRDLCTLGSPDSWRNVAGAHPNATMTVVFFPMHYRNAKNPAMPKWWLSQNNGAVTNLTNWALDKLNAVIPIRNGWSGEVGQDVVHEVAAPDVPLEELGGRQGPGGVYLLDTWRLSRAVVEQCPMGKPPNAPGGTHLGPPGSRIKGQLLMNLLSEVMDGIEYQRQTDSRQQSN